MEQLIELGASGTSSRLDCQHDASAATVEIVNPLMMPEWNATIVAGLGRSVFYSREWASVLAESYSYVPLYFVMRDHDGCKALFPVMEVNSLLTGKRGVSLPFTDTCAPYVPDSCAFHILLSRAVEEGRKRGWRHLDIRGGQQYLSALPRFLSFFEHVVSLPNTEAVFRELKPEVRTAIRRAEREGVMIRKAQSIDGLEAFYRMHCQVRRNHGVPPQPFEFFQSIWKHIVKRGMGSVWLARKGSKIIAAAIFFHWGEKVLYKFGASDRRFQHLRPNNLLFWEAMKYFATLGSVSMNFGRTSCDNDGLRRFKLGWGAQEAKVHYYRYNLKNCSFESGRDPVSGWKNTLLQRLPVAVNRWLGSLLYRHMG